jgi:hypothetical protein
MLAKPRTSALFFIALFTCVFACGTAPQEETTTNQNSSFNNSANSQSSQFQYSGFDQTNSGQIDPVTGESLFLGDARNSFENSLQNNPITPQDLQWSPTPEQPQSPGILDNFLDNRAENGGIFSRLRNRFFQR